MAHQATGAIVAKKFAHAYEESERLAAELSIYQHENAMLRDEIDRCLKHLSQSLPASAAFVSLAPGSA